MVWNALCQIVLHHHYLNVASLELWDNSDVFWLTAYYRWFQNMNKVMSICQSRVKSKHEKDIGIPCPFCPVWRTGSMEWQLSHGWRRQFYKHLSWSTTPWAYRWLPHCRFVQCKHLLLLQILQSPHWKECQYLSK